MRRDLAKNRGVRRELLSKGLELESIDVESGRVSARVESGATGCVCPVCGRGSSRARSHYSHTVSDLLWHGISVALEA